MRLAASCLALFLLLITLPPQVESRSSESHIAIAELGESCIFYGAWHPDGNTFVAATGNDFRVYESFPILSHILDDTFLLHLEWLPNGRLLFAGSYLGNEGIYLFDVEREEILWRHL